MKQQRYGQAIRLASTVGLSREAWLDIRQRGIGSSDAAVAVGLSPYKSALSLWLEKTGRKQPEDLSSKEAVLWGTVLCLTKIAQSCILILQTRTPILFLNKARSIGP